MVPYDQLPHMLGELSEHPGDYLKVVGLFHLVPVLHGELLAGVAALDAGAVDQDVDFAPQQLQGAGEAGQAIELIYTGRVPAEKIISKVVPYDQLPHMLGELDQHPGDYLKVVGLFHTEV